MRDDELGDLDWVLWELLVWDPGQVTACGVGERTEDAVTRLAESLGCVFEVCWDDDSVDEVPYYSWWIRVPQHEHRRRCDHDVPVVVSALHAYLRTEMPRLTSWQIRSLATESYRHHLSSTLRATYQDLLDPLETALLDLRRDGAENLDAQARYWWHSNDRFAGTYALWLCSDPDTAASNRWLVLDAGVTVPDDFWTSTFGQGLRRYITPGSPVLLLPRPAECSWLVTVTTGAFPAAPKTVRSDAVGASYRWTSRDGDALARRVAADLTAMLPALTGPGRR